jgi:hypothetical protein
MINQDKRSSDTSERVDATLAELSDVTEATAVELSGVVEAISAESPSVTNRKARRALRDVVSNGSAGAGSKPKISRELANLIRSDQTSLIASQLRAMLNLAGVGSIAGQTRGRMASRNPRTEGVRFFSAEGRHGGRSLSADSRRSVVLLDVTKPTTKKHGEC